MRIEIAITYSMRLRSARKSRFDRGGLRSSGELSLAGFWGLRELCGLASIRLVPLSPQCRGESANEKGKPPSEEIGNARWTKRLPMTAKMIGLVNC